MPQAGVTAVVGCFPAAYAEGLSDVLAETNEQMRDLFNRRIAFTHKADLAVITDAALGAEP